MPAVHRTDGFALRSRWEGLALQHGYAQTLIARSARPVMGSLSSPVRGLCKVEREIGRKSHLALSSGRVIESRGFSQVNLKNANEPRRLERNGNVPYRLWPEKPFKHSHTESFALDSYHRGAVQLAPFNSNVLALPSPTHRPGDGDGSFLARECSVFDCIGGQLMETQ